MLQPPLSALTGSDDRWVCVGAVTGAGAGVNAGADGPFSYWARLNCSITLVGSIGALPTEAEIVARVRWKAASYHRCG